MNVLEIEKLNQLVSRTDMSGNQKVEWLVNFIEKREQALSQHDVIKNEVAVCDNCKDVQGMYLGMTCPKCNRSFRCVKQTVL